MYANRYILYIYEYEKHFITILTSLTSICDIFMYTLTISPEKTSRISYNMVGYYCVYAMKM